MNFVKLEALRSELKRAMAHEVFLNWDLFRPELDLELNGGERYLHDEMTRPFTDLERSYLDNCPPCLAKAKEDGASELLIFARGDVSGYWLSTETLAESPIGEYSIEVSAMQMYEIESADEPTQYRDLTACWSIHFSINPTSKRAFIISVGKVDFEHSEAEI